MNANSFRGISIKSTTYQAKRMRKQLISFAQGRSQGFSKGGAEVMEAKAL